MTGLFQGNSQRMKASLIAQTREAIAVLRASEEVRGSFEIPEGGWDPSLRSE